MLPFCTGTALGCQTKRLRLVPGWYNMGVPIRQTNKGNTTMYAQPKIMEFKNLFGETRFRFAWRDRILPFPGEASTAGKPAWSLRVYKSRSSAMRAGKVMIRTYIRNCNAAEKD